MFRYPNGDMEFEKEGITPPPDVAGFKRDQLNPWLFHLDLEPCRYRQEKHLRQPCGKLVIAQRCTLKDRQVDPMFCSTCLEQEE